MIGHRREVAFQRRAFSCDGSSTTVPRPLQPLTFYEDSAPDDFSRFTHAFDRSAAPREIHGGLAFAHGIAVAVLKMCRRNRA